MTLLCFLDLLPCIALIYTYHHARERGGVLQTPFAVQEHRPQNRHEEELRYGVLPKHYNRDISDLRYGLSTSTSHPFPKRPSPILPLAIYQCQLGPL